MASSPIAADSLPRVSRPSSVRGDKDLTLFPLALSMTLASISTARRGGFRRSLLVTEGVSSLTCAGFVLRPRAFFSRVIGCHQNAVHNISKNFPSQFFAPSVA
jgi:hypothetical protein